MEKWTWKNLAVILNLNYIMVNNEREFSDTTEQRQKASLSEDSGWKRSLYRREDECLGTWVSKLDSHQSSDHSFHFCRVAALWTQTRKHITTK